MQSVVTDGVAWSVCWSVCHDREPCKTAETIQMPFELWTYVAPRNPDGGPEPPWEEALLRRMTSGFSRMPPSTVPSGLSIGISQYAVDLRSDLPGTKALQCHIKFSE